MTFAEKLKQARTQAGYTQEELAAILAVSRPAIAKWESGRGLPDVSNLKAIAQALGTTVDALLSDEAPWTSPSRKRPSTFLNTATAASSPG